MQSNNPVFSRNDDFNGRNANNYGARNYSDPSQWQLNLDDRSGEFPSAVTTGPVQNTRMTIESVVEKTGITLGLVTIAAAVTWFVIGDLNAVDNAAALSKAFALATGGAFIGFGLSMVNSFKRVISPALVLAYAVAEGVFVGAFSKFAAAWAGDSTIVFQAVFATIVAFAGTLTAYKFFNIRVTPKFQRVVTIAMFSFVGAMLVNFVLSMTGVLSNGGLRGLTPLGALVSLVAVVLAVFMLVMDFDYVERGVAAGLPERESWRAAFGLTVTLVWLYIELLRLLMILQRLAR